MWIKSVGNEWNWIFEPIEQRQVFEDCKCMFKQGLTGEYNPQTGWGIKIERSES